MSYKYIKLIAMLLTLCLLTACAAPAKDTAVGDADQTVTVESCTSEVPEETPASSPAPWDGYTINSPEMAVETARAELAKMQAMGMLSDSFRLSEAEPDNVMFLADEEYLSRSGSPCFAVHWFGDISYENNWEGENRYSVRVELDADSGKLMLVTIEAAADENAEVKYEIPVETGWYNELTGEEETRQEIWLYHENFSDIFDDDMTVNRFCDLLNEYWGFEGWTLGGGGALDLEVPLKDITSGTTANYHVALKFAGDEEGKYMYLQISEFPGRVCLMFGTDYAKG